MWYNELSVIYLEKGDILIIYNNFFNLEQIADSGQCFRMNRILENKYSVVACGKKLVLSQKENQIFFDCSDDDFENIWKGYFDLESDYKIYSDAIKNGDDEYLKKAIEYGKGIRILNQEPWETLLSFIISQQMRIPRIRQLVEKIASSYGEEIEENYFIFPSAEKMKNVSESELMAIGFGYRAKYIVSAVEKVCNGDFDLNKPFHLDYESCREYLKTLTGVGNKVADCVSLFAYHKTNAFPIDTWMKKIIERHYKGSFDRTKYKGYEGIVQQYMFYYERYNS